MNGNGSGTRPRRPPAAVERRTIRFSDAVDRTLAMEHWYWTALDQIAEHEGTTTDELVRDINHRRGAMALVPALRTFCVGYFQRAATGRADLDKALDEATRVVPVMDDDVGAIP